MAYLERTFDARTRADAVTTAARSADANITHGRHVALWLFSVAALVFVMVIVGGATRLTGSGLSITEWRPITGALPPLSDAAWLAEFEKYRAIPQYELLNKGLSLGEFKFIYWWEWGHRFLGRLIGLAYVLPLAWFIWRGALRGRVMWALIGLGALGGLQGFIGWLMVASGLQPGMIAVAPVKLMLHLTLACVIFSLLIFAAAGQWHHSMPHRSVMFREPNFGRQGALPAVPSTGGQDRTVAGIRSARVVAGVIVILVLMQIALGALVAGSKAGLTYNTWPLMDGRLIPPVTHLMLGDRPWIENFVDNPTLVQFNHRLGAYLLLVVAIWHALRLSKIMPGSGAAREATAVAALVLAQAAMGVATLLLWVPLWAGLAHQAMAVIVLGVATLHARRLGFASDMSQPAKA
jgi:cytochrome c oxidase assembly protein subunit 15